MIKFFRKIRQNLLSDGKTGKYFKYAIGEIVLIVLGILIALQFQNFNEKHRRDLLFKESMEQIYNGLKSDIDEFNGLIYGLNWQVKLIDLVLNQPDSLGLLEAPFALHYIYYDYVTIKTETEFFTKNLIYNPERFQQKNMAKNMARYIMKINKFKSNINIDINEILNDNGLPRPDLSPHNPDATFVQDSTYFSESQIKIAGDLIQSERFRTTLKTVRTKTNYDIRDIKSLLAESKLLYSSIKKLIPEVRIIYENVGIIGTAISGFDDVGATSTPMSETDFAVFETELFLKKGMVKFRCNDSWIKNWGGDTFPEGEAISDGINIKVDQPGQYHIRLDLNQNSYYFLKLSE